jgi:hypothetical protein
MSANRIRCVGLSGAAVAASILVGCGAATATTTTPVTPSPAVSAAGLARLLSTAAPAGFVQQPDSVGNTGPSDLAKAVRDDGKPDAASALTKAGFVAGYQRLWALADGTYAVVYLYNFSNRAGTVSYEQRGLSILASDAASKTTQHVAVPDIPGAVGITGTSQNRTIDAVVYTKGDYLVQVAMQGPSATYVSAEQMAASQFSRLP